MTAKRIDGKAAAAELRERVGQAAAAFRSRQGRSPGLAVVLVGEHPPSAAYVRSKIKATLEAGMESFEHRLPADISEAELIALVERLNADPAVDGILVQLPLPRQLQARAHMAVVANQLRLARQKVIGWCCDQRICAGLHRWDSFESILLDFKRTLDNFLRFRRAFGETDK